MVVHSIAQAATHFEELVDAACIGHMSIITRDGIPIAVLSPYKDGKGPRNPGALKGRIHIKHDFDSLPPDIEDAF